MKELVAVFDKNEIARMAIARTSVIKANKAHKNKLVKICSLSGLCAAAALFIILSNLAPFSGSPFLINDPPMPLAPLPTDSDEEYSSGSEAGDYQVFLALGIESVTVAAGTTMAEIQFRNPESNHCWLGFEIILKDTGEMLYKSGMVAPEENVETISLLRPLDTGEYEAYLIISAYEPHSLTLTGSAKLTISLIAN